MYSFFGYYQAWVHLDFVFGTRLQVLYGLVVNKLKAIDLDKVFVWAMIDLVHCALYDPVYILLNETWTNDL